MHKAFFGQLGKLKKEKVETYRALHLSPWPEVVQMIKNCNITSYSIFLHNDLVFSYFEYEGDDYTADMEKMAQDKKTVEWWSHTKPCFEKYAMNSQAEFYCNMEQIFCLDASE